MPRTLSYPAQTYQPGTYGPLTLNGFSSANTDWLVISLTVLNWPARSDLIKGSLRWSTGDGADFVISSPPRDRFGNPLSVVNVRSGVPRVGNGKGPVNQATATFVVAEALATAVTFQAV